MLTLEEMERQEFQAGDTERAELLRLAIEKQDEDGLAEEAEYERERAEESEIAMSDLKIAIEKCLIAANKAVEEKNWDAVQTALDNITGEL